MIKLTILHPFTSKAAGVVEKSVPTYHSQPHVKAMEKFANDGYTCTMEYLTPNFFKYKLKGNLVDWVFYPVSYTLNGDNKKWKQQSSKVCLRAYKKNTPDVTIINMSGHSSAFSYELSKIILENKKAYIAMLGGQHYTDTNRNREYYKNAHHILVHTYLQKKSMEKLEQFENKDIRVIPLGVDCTVFKPNQINKKNKAPTLLYVGRIVELKRIHLAIKALKKLIDNGFENAKLNIIGPTSSEKYYNELKKMTCDLDLGEHVFFLGHKEHSELIYYFQEADLFTLPSTHESFGMVIVESMACGTPVAALKGAGGPDELIEDRVNGILTSSENYAEEILKYFKNKEQQKAISEKARIKVLNEYSIEATCEVLRTSVESALK